MAFQAAPAGQFPQRLAGTDGNSADFTRELLSGNRRKNLKSLPDKEIDGHFGHRPGIAQYGSHIAARRQDSRYNRNFPDIADGRELLQRQVVGNHAIPLPVPRYHVPAQFDQPAVPLAEGVDRLKKLIVRMHECTQNMGHFTEHIREVYMTVSIACIDLILFYGIIIIKQKEVYFKYII